MGALGHLVARDPLSPSEGERSILPGGDRGGGCGLSSGHRVRFVTGSVMFPPPPPHVSPAVSMRSDLARAYLEGPGGARVEPRDGSALLAFLQPGQAADVTLAFPAPPNVRDAPASRAMAASVPVRSRSAARAASSMRGLAGR